jgi:hypothetical protein
VGNVLAALDADALAQSEQGREQLRQILLERYLVSIDNGWIFRGARYYRGAFQIEDEISSARRLLVALARASQGQARDFLLLRTAARLLPHGSENAAVIRVRNLSTQLGEADDNFANLRNKIHAQPDAGDARRVRDYLAKAPARLQDDYRQLAAAIDQVYRHDTLDTRLAAVIASLPHRQVAEDFRQARRVFANPDASAALRLRIAANLLLRLREQTPDLTTAAQWLDVLDASLALEQQVFSAAATLRQQVDPMNRHQRLALLAQLATALYGSGELSQRQWQALRASFAELQGQDIPLDQYRAHLQYLARVSHWVDRWYRFHFGDSVQHLATIEPKVTRFLPDRLRGGPVLHYAALLDDLIIDADRLAGVQHRIFGTTTGSGVRMLNPGLARGVLHLLPDTGAPRALQSNGIYVLPDTTASLDPVAGILTLGQGNALSHVQILARNLGIPNVLIERQLLPTLQLYADSPIVMAVSPAGRVVLAQDGPTWQAVFGNATPVNDDPLPVDLDKLALSRQKLLSLDEIRAVDTGVLAGPKAANLGELRHHFPEQVPPGVIIPFGLFHAMLQQPVDGGELTLFEWMQSRYRYLDSLQGEAYTQVRNRFLQELQTRILQTEFSQAFRTRLRNALTRAFGADTNVTLFVRSDTNMEDLPGFTGAGLNLTVPNVKGFDALLQAIKRVWASPFSQRAFAWRQQRMARPEHVYVSVLLMPSVAVSKSGVMVTSDITRDKPGWITIAANEGIGGAVQGQAAEELRMNSASGQVQLLQEATAPTRRVLNSSGGLSRVPVSGHDRVLTDSDLAQLRQLARQLPRRYPMLDDQGRPTPADVEFGYHDGKLVLFQVRPYLTSRRALQDQYLRELDRGLAATADSLVQLDAPPRE